MNDPMLDEIDGSRLLTVQQAADYLGLKKQTIYLLVSRRKIAHFKLGSAVRFRLDDLERWLQERRVEAVVFFPTEAASMVEQGSGAKRRLPATTIGALPC